MFMQFIDKIVDFLFDEIIDIKNIKDLNSPRTNQTKSQLIKEREKYDTITNYKPIGDTTLTNISVNLHNRKPLLNEAKKYDKQIDLNYIQSEFGREYEHSPLRKSITEDIHFTNEHPKSNDAKSIGDFSKPKKKKKSIFKKNSDKKNSKLNENRDQESKQIKYVLPPEEDEDYMFQEFYHKPTQLDNLKPDNEPLKHSQLNDSIYKKSVVSIDSLSDMSKSVDSQFTNKFDDNFSNNKNTLSGKVKSRNLFQKKSKKSNSKTLFVNKVREEENSL